MAFSSKNLLRVVPLQGPFTFNSITTEKNEPSFLNFNKFVSEEVDTLEGCYCGFFTEEFFCFLFYLE